MQRTWTDKTREEWIGRRTERRRQASRPNPRSPRDDSLEREKGKVYDSLVKLITRTSSWEVHKHPVRAYPAPFSGRLYVPLRYCENDEERTVQFNQGYDLTTLVYRFYNEKPDLSFIGDNYVATDGISPKRYIFSADTYFTLGHC
ncbi:hypothetical protein K474DRAFT_1771069 [Panus rudis PR-1116 ss-1]|nr:hypothetical protein K474DRAFT_1771069 [Panus rudis PR-1116 ss-1]